MARAFAEGAHLVRRFAGFLGAEPLSPREQDEVSARLDPRLAQLFFSQPGQDQRHALQVARRVELVRPGDAAATEAALLHDIGKRHSGLGAIGRSLATVLGRLRLPVTARMHTYLDHGAIGADEAAAAGATAFTVLFTRLHPAPPPPTIDGDRWHAVARADEA